VSNIVKAIIINGERVLTEKPLCGEKVNINGRDAVMLNDYYVISPIPKPLIAKLEEGDEWTKL